MQKETPPPIEQSLQPQAVPRDPLPLAPGLTLTEEGFRKETQKTDCKCLQNTALILLLIQIREKGSNKSK